VTIVRIKGFKIFQDRQGRWRCYHRQTGVAIKAPIGSAEFLAECAAIIAKNVAKPAPGTLGLLIADYRASQVFSDLAPRTRTDYQRIFDYLHVIDGTILTHFNRPLVVKIRDKAAASKGRGAPSAATSRRTPPLPFQTSGGKEVYPRRTGHGAIKSVTSSLKPRHRLCAPLSL